MGIFFFKDTPLTGIRRCYRVALSALPVPGARVPSPGRCGRMRPEAGCRPGLPVDACGSTRAEKAHARCGRCHGAAVCAMRRTWHFIAFPHGSPGVRVPGQRTAVLGAPSHQRTRQAPMRPLSSCIHGPVIPLAVTRGAKVPADNLPGTVFASAPSAPRPAQACPRETLCAWPVYLMRHSW